MFAASAFSYGPFIDPDEERDPPPKATPVSFPPAKPTECRAWDEERPPPDFQGLFTRVLKPTDISEEHVKALNINLQSQCSIEDMLPLAPDGSSYLQPQMEEKQPEEKMSYANATKAVLGVSDKRKELHDRISELSVDNTTAYRVITGNPERGVKPLRLAYLRNFWQGMESMSQYWDCTLDQYYSVAETTAEREKSPKRQKLDSETEAKDSAKSNLEAGDPLPLRSSSEQNGASDRLKSSHEDTPDNPTGSSDSTLDVPKAARPKKVTEPRTAMRYKGLRTGSGRYMPDRFRNDAIRGFVEGAVFPFKCNVYPPRMMPLVHFNKLKLPVRQSFAVYQLPQDRMKARAGELVGPAMGVQVRSDTDFDGDEQKGRLDLMRELGGLLQLAQERAREGKTETKPGDGEWWTTVPRWGGGPGGEVESPEDGHSDIVEMAPEILGAGGKDAGQRRQKKAPARLWKELRCGSGYFDPKTEYKAIGKEPDSEIDEIFLVSALNHHVSIVKLTIHRAYTEYLSAATMPSPLPEDPKWCRPTLQRTKWFDLFEKDGRIEAFRATWGVAGYLMREIGGEGQARMEGSY